MHRKSDTGDAVSRRRGRPVGPAAWFGRGRALLAALMLFLVAFAFLSEVRQRPLTATRPNPRTLPTAQAPISVERMQLLSSQDREAIVRHHHGLVVDERSKIVSQIGNQIHAVAAERLPAEMHFELLDDNMQPIWYAFDDGTICITMALARMTETQEEVAAMLSDQLERFARARGALAASVEYGKPSRIWMERSGYNPEALAKIQERHAKISRSQIE